MDTVSILPFLPPLLLVPAMGILSRLRSNSTLGRELRRKALHVGVGLTALIFPYVLTETWMVLCALVAIGCWMLAVRSIPLLRRHFGAVLHDAKRISHGELYFAVSIAGLLLLAADNPLQFVVPVLILTVSDAAAAVAGTAYPRGQLSGIARHKTMTGSVTFLVTAFLITFWGLLRYTGLAPTSAVAISIVVATGTCVVEAVSQRGRDNILVPATAFLLLEFAGA